MGKIRINKLALELNIQNDQILSTLREKGHSVKNYMSSIDNIVADEIRELFNPKPAPKKVAPKTKATAKKKTPKKVTPKTKVTTKKAPPKKKAVTKKAPKVQAKATKGTEKTPATTAKKVKVKKQKDVQVTVSAAEKEYHWTEIL